MSENINTVEVKENTVESKIIKKNAKGDSLEDLFFNTANIRPHRIPIRFIRWFIIIALTFTFAISYKLDLDFLPGSLNGSRLSGFGLIDLYTFLEYVMAHKSIAFNAAIGVATIAIAYILLGGRFFCSWICPYNLLAEIGEIIHVFLVKKNIIKRRRQYKQAIRYAFWIMFLVIPLFSGVIAFEMINPVAYLNRAFIYGPTFLLIWVFLLLVFEVFFVRRAWCRYACPMGTTYGMLGKISFMRVEFDTNACTNCGNCYKVCIDPSLLVDAYKEGSYKGNQTKKAFVFGETCTNCGRCIDVCKYDALHYKVRFIDEII